jgi:hypothetical protein
MLDNSQENRKPFDNNTCRPVPYERLKRLVAENRKAFRECGTEDFNLKPAFSSSIVGDWCETKPPITPDAVKAFGGFLARWPASAPACYQQIVIAFPGRDEAGNVTGFIILDAQGRKLRQWDKGVISWDKVRVARGTGPGLVGATPDQIRAAETIWKAEGITDALAVYSRLPTELRGRHVVVTNSQGASERPQRYASELFAGKDVILAGDADQAGQVGNNLWDNFLAGTAKSVAVVKFPWEITESHGKDSRDFLQDHTFDDLYALAKVIERPPPPVAANLAEAWNEPTPPLFTPGTATEPPPNPAANVVIMSEPPVQEVAPCRCRRPGGGRQLPVTAAEWQQLRADTLGAMGPKDQRREFEERGWRPVYTCTDGFECRVPGREDENPSGRINVVEFRCSNYGPNGEKWVSGFDLYMEENKVNYKQALLHFARKYGVLPPKREEAQPAEKIVSFEEWLTLLEQGRQNEAEFILPQFANKTCLHTRRLPLCKKIDQNNKRPTVLRCKKFDCIPCHNWLCDNEWARHVLCNKNKKLPAPPLLLEWMKHVCWLPDDDGPCEAYSHRAKTWNKKRLKEEIRVALEKGGELGVKVKERTDAISAIDAEDAEIDQQVAAGLMTDGIGHAAHELTKAKKLELTHELEDLLNTRWDRIFQRVWVDGKSMRCVFTNYPFGGDKQPLEPVAPVQRAREFVNNLSRLALIKGASDKNKPPIKASRALRLPAKKESMYTLDKRQLEEGRSIVPMKVYMEVNRHPVLSPWIKYEKGLKGGGIVEGIGFRFKAGIPPAIREAAYRAYHTGVFVPPCPVSPVLVAEKDKPDARADTRRALFDNEPSPQPFG